MATVPPPSKLIIKNNINIINGEYFDMPAYIVGLPAFAAWFACGLLSLAVFGYIYTRITKHDEIKLMREGNVSASIASIGFLIGYSIPLSSAATHTVTIGEFLVWALVGFVAQVLAYVLSSYFQPGLSERISNNDIAAGIWKGGFAIAVGMINAACMTY